MPVEVDAPVVRKRDALAPKPFFHDVGRLEVLSSRKGPVAIHDAVARTSGPSGSVQSPAHESGGAAAAQVLGDVAVSGHSAGWNLVHDGPHALKKRIGGVL